MASCHQPRSELFHGLWLRKRTKCICERFEFSPGMFLETLNVVRGLLLAWVGRFVFDIHCMHALGCT